jgi:alpha-galactosidase
VLEGIARDVEEVCPDAWFLNYTNPMSMLTGYMLRYTKVKTVGLCHSVQACSRGLLDSLGISYTEPIRERIAGLNHMGWLLEIRDADGTDLYPEIRKRAVETLERETAGGKSAHGDLVRFEYIRRFGYYCTESSEHNAEYNNFFIKAKYPELIERYNIPLDEYPRRCVEQIKGWETLRDGYVGASLTHEKTCEYASRIMDAMVTDTPYRFGGNVVNRGLIDNLPKDACVEVFCVADGNGVSPLVQGALPVQLAALNMTAVNVQLLTIEAAVTGKREHVYQAALLDPHASSELSIDGIVALCDDMIEAHGDWLPRYG